jgi:pimeloyl-ACP methyl ester carboxylesterase
MPQTSVSLYVAAFMALGGLVIVLALLVVRRRRRLLPMLALGAVTLVLVAAGTVFLIVPPRVPSLGGVQQSGRCPYDRLTWSNMPSDVDDFWQPCRRVARVELALTLVGGSAVTVMAAAMALKRPARSPRDQLPATASLPR